MFDNLIIGVRTACFDYVLTYLHFIVVNYTFTLYYYYLLALLLSDVRKHCDTNI